MNCPNCGAPMRPQDGRDCLICDYCKSVFFPQSNEEGIRILEDPSELSCPVCAVPLLHAILDGHGILYCARCRGSLIPAPVFVLIVQDLRAHRADAAATQHPPDARELKRRIQCPQCHGLMDTHYYAGPGNIVIDDCPSCELNWMDAGELMVVVRAPDHSYEQERGSMWQYPDERNVTE